MAGRAAVPEVIWARPERTGRGPEARVQPCGHRGRGGADRRRRRAGRGVHAACRGRTGLRDDVAVQLRPPQGGPVRADGRRGQRGARAVRADRGLAGRHAPHRPPDAGAHAPARLDAAADVTGLRLQPQRPALPGALPRPASTRSTPRTATKMELVAMVNGVRDDVRRERAGHGRAGALAAVVARSRSSAVRTAYLGSQIATRGVSADGGRRSRRTRGRSIWTAVFDRMLERVPGRRPRVLRVAREARARLRAARTAPPGPPRGGPAPRRAGGPRPGPGSTPAARSSARGDPGPSTVNSACRGRSSASRASTVISSSSSEVHACGQSPGGSPPACPAPAGAVRRREPLLQDPHPADLEVPGRRRHGGDAALAEVQGLLVAVVARASRRAGPGAAARTYGRRPPGSLGRSPLAPAHCSQQQPAAQLDARATTASGSAVQRDGAPVAGGPGGRQDPGEDVLGVDRDAPSRAPQAAPSSPGARFGSVPPGRRYSGRIRPGRPAGEWPSGSSGQEQRGPGASGARRARPRRPAARPRPATARGGPRRSAGGRGSATARRRAPCRTRTGSGQGPVVPGEPARAGWTGPGSCGDRGVRRAGAGRARTARSRLGVPRPSASGVPAGPQGGRRPGPSASRGRAAAVRRTTA